MYTLVNQVIFGSDNGLSPVRHQAIIWTNAGILLIRNLGTNFSEILNIQENTFENVVCEMATILYRPKCANCSVWSQSNDTLWSVQNNNLQSQLAIEGGGFESPSGRDILFLKNTDTFRKTSVRVSKMNAVTRAQLTFQMLTLLWKWQMSIFHVVVTFCNVTNHVCCANFLWQHTIWGLVCQLVSRAVTSNYISQVLWGVIACPCLWYLIRAHNSSYVPTQPLP